MARKALIDGDNKVVNLIEIEDDAAWDVPAGHQLLDGAGADIGEVWDGSNFVPDLTPPPSPRVFSVEELQAQVDAISTLAEAKTFLRRLVRGLANIIPRQ